jgi:Cysteine-rich CPCC
METPSNKYTCRCCGYKSLSSLEPDIGIPDEGIGCPICMWQVDFEQEADPDLQVQTSYNDVSLRRAQKNFIEFGASDKRVIKMVRKPTEQEVKDSTWSREDIGGPCNGRTTR